METNNVENQNVEASSGGGAPQGGGTSRWNPTKEQIDILENLYKQGIRTPSAEQIQQITGRLKVYGHIEGKNVFYWFQNHKARQRQRQKQENLAYVNRFVHHHPTPLFPPPCPNVICRPYYIPTQTTVDHHHQQLGFYPQYFNNTTPKTLLPAGSGVVEGLKRRPSVITNHENMEIIANICTKIDRPAPQNNRETLALFPLQPTGNLQRTTSTTFQTSSLGPSFTTTTPSLSTSSTSCEQMRNVANITGIGSDNDNNKLFYDFFSGKDSSCDTSTTQ
ncbi:hypothetical protein ACFE04_015395 [Oxalis oulophora]